MKLTPNQQAMLDGQQGWPLQIAMRMLTAVGRALDAPDLIPVTSTHLVIDGTALGEAGRDFLERLVAEGRGDVHDESDGVGGGKGEVKSGRWRLRRRNRRRRWRRRGACA